MNHGISEFGHVLLYLAGGAIFIGLIALLNKLLAPNHPNPEKLTTYECGEDPVGNANVQFNIRFYVVGLIFLIFDVEILFLFPWATIFADVKIIQNVPLWGVFALAEMSIFVVILLLGLLYVWVKGDLEWIKPEALEPERINPVPDSLYEEINRKYTYQSTVKKTQAGVTP
ncbi:MAG: NADH-quinone oxidoreductase subunit A [Bacteroidia bacterium]|nr:NADH-quinone oxidoreductase subunit A [Bacteroidia bacterium]